MTVAGIAMDPTPCDPARLSRLEGGFGRSQAVELQRLKLASRNGYPPVSETAPHQASERFEAHGLT
jgi:hypothetical protein